MKLIVIFVAFFALAAAYEVELLTGQQWEQFLQDKTVTPEARGIILNPQVKKVVKNFLKQMPCGWPEYGIPPLAPYTNVDLKIHLVNSFVDSFIELIRFRFDGLDQMIINNLKVSYTFKKKVKFHVTFKELKATAFRYDTNTFLDAMKQLGLTVRYEGIGPLEFALENLSIEGEFKYTMPWFFGSIQIYNFKCVVTLGSVRSNIGGILGEGNLNALINSQIEEIIPTIVNSNQAKINAVIEENVVPRVNKMLKGKKIWYILGQLGGSSRKCDPTPAPWLAAN